MAQDILATDLQPIRIQLDELTKNIHQMTIDTGLESLAAAVSELRNTLHEPFLFVIVGEVKAGKSSFINALLATGKEVVKVAPDPCTDTIQQVMYGAEAQTITVNPYLKKIQQPVEILKHISVVDTPGTNTISDHHQEITEGFVPRSDLIVFVFEAKNPYRQSAWEFFDYIHADWRKKVIFVLQQADLMNDADLKVNIEGVSKYARKKGIEDPLVFALSAKLEQEGDLENSGFGPLKTYLRANITGRNAHLLKLISNLDTAENIQSKVYTRLEAMETQLKADRDFRADVIHTLRDQEGRSQRQVEGLIDQLLGEYDRLTQEAAQELDLGLGFFALTKKSFLSVFSKQDSPQAWLKGLTERLQLQLSNSYSRKLNDGVEEIADSIGQMARIIDLKIKNSQTALKPAQDIFGEISDRRRMVLRDLQDGFTQFMQDTQHFVGAEVFPEASKFSPNIAAGSGIAVIGVVLTAATQLTALDITGGILSAAGLLFAGGTVVFKRGKIIRGFEDEIKKGREQLRTALDQKLKAYIAHIRKRIDSNFSDFDALLETETQQVEQLAERHNGIEAQIKGLREELGQ